jgi:hypothetical protein
LGGWKFFWGEKIFFGGVKIFFWCVCENCLKSRNYEKRCTIQYNTIQTYNTITVINWNVKINKPLCVKT